MYAQNTLGKVAYATAGADYATTDRIALLDSEINKVQEATSKVISLIASVRNVADSVFGPQPEQVNGVGAPMPTPGSRGEGLRTATNSLHAALLSLDDQIARLNAL